MLLITADGCPSELAVRENAWDLARYARTVQEEGLVPIVAPEILMDGDHDILATAALQEWVLRGFYDTLDYPAQVPGGPGDRCRRIGAFRWQAAGRGQLQLLRAST